MEYIKFIPKFSSYMVSQDGAIYSIESGIFLKPISDRKGYLYIHLYKNRKQYRKYIHRLILETFVGSCPKNMEACHNNGNPVDNKLENLRWDTSSNNTKDAIKHGTWVDNRGEKSGKAKLNKLQVRIIKHLLKWKQLFHREIAEIFNVKRNTISNIHIKNTWK